ncbi:MAG: glycosyltransferase [Desulfohalobiaceae bacterium]|nr:glycosyltransferase [Desulfohalobiaceae bacterium]
MKICMVTNTYLPHVGGVARSVHQFTEDLRSLGHEVLVLAPHFEGDRTEEREGVLRLPAIQNFNGSDFSVHIPLPFLIENELDYFSPDIIHSHHPFLLGNTALRIARKKNLPLVFTHHTLYEQYTHYVPLDSETLRKFVISLATLYANFCNRVIAPSQSIAGLIQSRGVQRPIEEIPTGVDLEFFAGGSRSRFRKKHGLPEKGLIIGHLGRLALEKNLNFLCRAVITYLRRNPNAFFLVVGEGPGQDSISRLSEESGVLDRVFLVGKKTGQELRDAYQAMDLFVFASKSETQGMVLTEAMAAGKPVIALDASGTREVVNDKENGRLLAGDVSPDRFAEAIAEFAEDSSKARHWQENALQTATLFSRQASARKLETLYKKVRNEQLVSTEGRHEEVKPLNSLISRIKTEWDILTQKTEAAADAFQTEKKRKG